MRIEAYNQVAQVYQTSNTKAAKSTTATNGTNRDEVQISSTGRDYQVAKKAVSEASDIREDLVADIKNKMKNGEYNVSTEDFAEKLLSAYNSLF